MGATDDKLAELEERIAALESAPAPDTLQPNVLTVNPDGTIGANLTGHLKAEGVDLDAGTVNAPPADDRVRWLGQNGAVVADITATEVIVDELIATAYGHGAGGEAIWQATEGAHNSAALFVQAIDGADGATAVILQCVNHAGTIFQRTLLDATGFKG